MDDVQHMTVQIVEPTLSKVRACIFYRGNNPSLAISWLMQSFQFCNTQMYGIKIK